MSTEEQDALRGRAMRELQGLRTQLHCMKQKATALARVIEHVAQRLTMEFDYAEIDEYPERQDVLGLAHGIVSLRQQIARQEDELRKLGIEPRSL